MISIKNSVLRFFGTRGIVNRIETIYGYIKIPSPLNKLKRLSNVTIGVTNDVTCDERSQKDLRFWPKSENKSKYFGLKYPTRRLKNLTSRHKSGPKINGQKLTVKNDL